MRRRFSVLKRSRGTNTRQERKRPKTSRRTNRRTRWRSPRWRIAIAISNSSSTEVWNSSSRGCVSRISISAFSLWLSGGNAARAMTASNLRRRIGISRGLAW